MASCVCFSTSSTAWGGESYMAEGVNAQNLTASERFYDNGKGYYWPWLNYTPFMGARSLYESTGSFAFLGDLASRIDTGSEFSTSSFSALTNDANTCWYNVASDVLQYWQSYYGVFANNIVYGYTYNKDYADELASHMGMEKQKDGSYQLIRKGQLVDLSIEHGGYGHALTCYGFTVSDSGMIESVQVTNSDDQSFELITLYVKYHDGAYHLYEVKACTKQWVYSKLTWQVSSISSIRTPDILLQMYDSYADADNALVWNGQKRYSKVWSAPSSSSIEELPDSNSSWGVKVMDEYFPAYAETGRKVRFDDYATNGTVKVQGTVETEEMHLANSSLYRSDLINFHSC